MTTYDWTALQADRETLRQRWRARGWHGDRTLGQALQEAATRYPATNFHFYHERGVTHRSAADLYAEAMKLAGGFHGRGLRAGDRVVVLMPTLDSTLEVYLALLHLGVVLVPVVHSYGVEDVCALLRQSAATGLVMPAQWRGIDFLQRYGACDDVRALRHWIVDGDAVPDGAVALASLQQGAPIPLPNLDADDVALLLYTSGTTAAPKGVQHSHNSLLAEWDTYPGLTLSPVLDCFPAGHIAGFLWMTMPFCRGLDGVFLDKWDPYQAAELFERHRVRESGGSPFFLATLLEACRHKPRDLGALGPYILGAAGVTPAHVALVDEMGGQGGRCYGLSEHPTVTCTPLDAPFAVRGHTDGAPCPGTEVRVVDDDGSDVAVGSDGEILTRGPDMFIGYTERALDLASFLPGGWFRTGDVGRLDSAGCLTITDRKKDLIIRGGENISSKEVEDILALHPAVQEAAVVAMPDPVYSERICAFVILHAGEELDLAAVRTLFSAQGISRQKVPEHLIVVDDFPRTAAGKIRKADLRQQVAGR